MPKPIPKLLDQYWNVRVDPDYTAEGRTSNPDWIYHFEVRSRSNAFTWHKVCIKEEGWNGWCDCDAFTFGCAPKIRSGEAIDEKRTRCWHIRRARSYFLDVLLPTLDLGHRLSFKSIAAKKPLWIAWNG